MASKKTIQDLLERARLAIENHEVVALDEAADKCQMIDNVGHMTWFVQRVAAEIAAKTKAYQHLTIPEDW
jgi:phage terminase Nu1 subunit (DNA packaging protein)